MDTQGQIDVERENRIVRAEAIETKEPVEDILDRQEPVEIEERAEVGGEPEVSSVAPLPEAPLARDKMKAGYRYAWGDWRAKA
jgi:hypothetical protein